MATFFLFFYRQSFRRSDKSTSNSLFAVTLLSSEARHVSKNQWHAVVMCSNHSIFLLSPFFLFNLSLYDLVLLAFLDLKLFIAILFK